MAIELWEERTGNAIDDFATEDEALAVVREMIDTHGKESVASWAMDVGTKRDMVRGDDLLNRPFRIPATR